MPDAMSNSPTSFDSRAIFAGALNITFPLAVGVFSNLAGPCNCGAISWAREFGYF